MSAFDLDILARTIYGEARGSSFVDQKAVASVMMNRARSKKFPNTVAQVCLQPKHFSCWNANDPNRVKLERVNLTDQAFVRCYHIATGVYLRLIEDETGGCDHYFARSIRPPIWSRAMKELFETNEHRFFKS